MGAIVIILIIACVVSAKFRVQVLSFILGAAILGLMIYLAIDNFSTLWPIALIGFGVLIVLGIIMVIVEDSRDKKAIAEWLSKRSNTMTSAQIENLLKSIIPELSKADSNPKNKYDYESSNIPFGRINCFLNYFDTSSEIEEPIYYSPIRSKDKVELREYGLALTTGGLYIAVQYDEKDQNENYKNEIAKSPYNKPAL